MANLLDMARLQSGSLKLRAEWCDVQDIVGVALRDIHDVVEGHPVLVNIGPDLPLVKADFGLIEHVLINLLENAAKYAPQAARSPFPPAPSRGPCSSASPTAAL